MFNPRSLFTRKASNAAGATSGALKSGLKATPKMFVAGMGVDTGLNMLGGDDAGTAVAKGFVTGALWTTMPGIMTAHLAATTAPQLFGAADQWKRSREAWWNQQHMPNFGGNYQDNQRALTMRQAAVQKIQGSKLNARSALGGEAQIMAQNFHRS